mmetsp:Transcript_13933/g.32685  ORF Transcript_13933/g.32685 Transcript_13933/m.32685 type:complete len:218 (+) Transcript_13933:474-1127(+)
MLVGSGRTQWVASRDASLQERIVDMRVWSNTKLGRCSLDKLEGALKAARLAQELHDDCESVGAGLETLLLHLQDQPFTFSGQASLQAPIQQRVVHNLISLASRQVFPQVPQHREGSLHIPLLAEALDHGAIGDEVGLQAPLAHILQEAPHSVHLPILRAGVDHCVVGDDGRLYTMRQHLVKDSPDSFHAMCTAVALEHRAENHRVDLFTALWVFKKS